VLVLAITLWPTISPVQKVHRPRHLARNSLKLFEHYADPDSRHSSFRDCNCVGRPPCLCQNG
jgi:hypothetical protein